MAGAAALVDSVLDLGTSDFPVSGSGAALVDDRNNHGSIKISIAHLVHIK